MIKKINNLIIAATLLSSSVSADSRNFPSQRGMIDTLQTVASCFRVGYAPYEWKKEYCGWELDQAVAEAEQAITLNPGISIQEFREVMNRFFFSTKDYHVGVSFHSLAFSSLPFQVKRVDGRYFIVSIDRKKAPNFPFHVGDELLLFDGKEVEEEVLALKNSYCTDANFASDIAEAALLLTIRKGWKAHECPRGPISVSIKRKGENEAVSHQLVWSHYPEKVLAQPDSGEPYQFRASFSKRERKELPCRLSFFRKSHRVQRFDRPKERDFEDETPFDLGSYKSMLPKLGKVLWVADTDFFQAYLYENEKRKRIGFLRIPHYSAGENGETKEFKKLIEKFEEQSDALVIDQLNNPGGSDLFGYSLCSLLTGHSLVTPTESFRITPEDVEWAVSMIPELEEVEDDKDAQLLFGCFCHGPQAEIDGYPVSYDFVQLVLEYCRFVVKEWKEGRQLTRPFHFFGVDHINPHPEVHYSKPIVMLINELDFSMGDFEPAILQDNNVVTLMGTSTGGAGGYVSRASFPNLYGIDFFHYTGSFARRPNGDPIENLGVQPDYPYELTVNDLENHFEDYVKEINSLVSEKIQEGR